MTSPAIAFNLSPPFSTVGLELRRLGLNRLSRLEPKPPVMRYAHKKPGDMVHLDFKQPGKIDGVGHRITADRSRRQIGAGWGYLHVGVDDNSRLEYSELLPDEKAARAACLLILAVDCYQRQGVAVRRVMGGNHGCHRSDLFKTAVSCLGLKHVSTRPYTPGTNGRAERLIQTSIMEWAHRQANKSSAKRQDHPGPWTGYSNNQRPHSALKYRPPISRLEKCEQRPC